MRGDNHKLDHGKPMWDLLPLNEVEEIVDVLTFGAKKYTANGWQEVPSAKERYFAAAMRHLKQYKCGENKDTESGISHLAHAACCIVFLMWFANNEKES